MGVERLRFKDENGNYYPDWKTTKLSDIGFFKTSSVDKKTKPDEQEVFLVNYMDVYNHLNLNNKTKNNLMRVSANSSQVKENNLLLGDILFTPSSETPDDIGHSVVIYEDLINTVYSYHLVRYRTTIQLDLDYAHYFCNTQDLLRQMTILSQGATRFTLSLKSFNELKISISQDVREQEKIGNFLSLFDRLIEKLETKIGLLKELKKGYLQQMFPAKDETIPKIRFKGYAEKWETHHLRNFLELISERNKKNSLNNVLSVSNKYGFINQTDQFKDRTVASKNLSNYKIVHKNDFAYNPARINVGSIARLDKYESGIVSPMYIVFRNKKQLNSEYFKYFLETKSFKDQMTRHLVGSVRQTLDFQALLLIILKTSSLPEQEKIGNFFKNFDEMIEKHKKELDVIEQFKKGYMQRLFA